MKKDFDSLIKHEKGETVTNLVRILLDSKRIQSMIVSGKGGIGKSFLITNEVKNTMKKKETAFVSGYSTPLALYKNLYKNRDKKLIVFDDCESLFDNRTSISLLKLALSDTKKRLIQYHSTSKKLGEASKEFVLGAKVIVLTNRIPSESDADVRAMLSRALYYELKLSYEEIVDISKQMIDVEKTLTKKQKKRAVELFDKHVTKATENLNLRTVDKLMTFVEAEGTSGVNAGAIFDAVTPKNMEKLAMLEAIEKYETVGEQVEYFCSNTGLSRRTFFRRKIDIGT